MVRSWTEALFASQDGERWTLRFYLLVGSLSMLALCWLTPPFQVPDEPQHFYRSYQVSRLELRPEVREGRAGAMLPTSLPELVTHHLGNLAHHQDRVVPRIPLNETLAGLGRPLKPEQQAFLEFSGSALYAPLGYAPQAAAMALGRAFDLGPLALMYAGRCGNALAVLGLTALALALLPAGRWFALVVALLPMTQFMTASLSPDATTIAGSFVVAAALLRFIEDGRWGGRRQCAFVIGGLLMCAVKVVYLPMLLCGAVGMFAAADRSDPLRRQAFIRQLGGVALVVLCIAFWFWYRPGGVHGGGGPAGVDAAAQLAYLREQPLRPLRIVLRSLYKEAGFLSESLIGLLGWLNVHLSPVLLACAGLAAAFSLLEPARRARPGWAAALVVALLAFTCVALIELALYVAWTPVANYSAKGVQGRYFIPLLPLLGTALAWPLSKAAPLQRIGIAKWIVAAGVLSATLGMQYTVIRGYSLF